MTLAKKAFSFLKNSFNLTKKLTLNLSDNPSDFSISHKIARFKQENEGQICNFFLLYFKKSGKYWNKLTRSSGWLFEWSCQRRTFIRHFCSVTAQFKLSNSNRPNHVHKSQNYNFPKNRGKKDLFCFEFLKCCQNFFCEKAGREHSWKFQIRSKNHQILELGIQLSFSVTRTRTLVAERAIDIATSMERASVLFFILRLLGWDSDSNSNQNK